MEQEVLQIAQHVSRLAVYHHLLLAFGEVVHHRAVRIQLRTVLVKIGHFQLSPAVNTAAVSLQLTEHQLEQRGFTTAVRANEGNFIATLHLSGEVFHQNFSIDLVIDIFHFKDNLTGAGCLFDLHLCTSHHFTASAALVTHRLQCTHAAFVTGTAGFNTLTDPDLFLCQLAVKLRILQLFHAQVFFFFQQIGIVIARIGDQLAAIEIDNTRRHVADKRTVV